MKDSTGHQADYNPGEPPGYDDEREDEPTGVDVEAIRERWAPFPPTHPGPFGTAVVEDIAVLLAEVEHLRAELRVAQERIERLTWRTNRWKTEPEDYCIHCLWSREWIVVHGHKMDCIAIRGEDE